jgi:Putative MetA-pathway of phenol degradation
MHTTQGFPSNAIISLAAAIGTLGVPSAGHAAHPYITDDAGTVGKNTWQLELQAEHNRHDRSADPGGGTVRQVRRIFSFNPVLTYGVRDDLDIALGLNHLRESVKEDGVSTKSVSGMGDSTVALKWTFYEADGLTLGLKPTVALPTGDESRGLGTGRVSWGINTLLGYQVKPWEWLVNLEYAEVRFKRAEDANTNHRHLWRFSVGVGYSLSDQFRLVGEAGVRANPAKNDPFLPGRNGNFAMLGLIYSPTDKFDFDIGVRRSVSPAELDLALLLGATVRW